jgi:putative DNA primase/helicase
VFDEFSQEIQIARALPWDDAGSDVPRPWGVKQRANLSRFRG